MNGNNNLLKEIFGDVEYDWENQIIRIIHSRIPEFSKSGQFDDVLTDLISDLYFTSKKGGLSKAIISAKQKSNESVKNMINVFRTAVHFRVSNIISEKKRKRTESFTDLLIKENSYDYFEYEEELIYELEMMATAAEREKKYALAKYSRFAKEMIPGKLQGKTMSELKKEFNISSFCMMQKIDDVMKDALTRILGRFGYDNSV
jgi:hypothetical protein